MIWKYWKYRNYWNYMEILELCCKSTLFQTNSHNSKKNSIIPHISNISVFRCLIGIMDLVLKRGLAYTSERQPATPGQATGAGPRALERWTISPMLPSPKCLISQCFSQRAKMLMTGKLTCSNLVEKAKLLKTKELQK